MFTTNFYGTDITFVKMDNFQCKHKFERFFRWVGISLGLVWKSMKVKLKKMCLEFNFVYKSINSWPLSSKKMNKNWADNVSQNCVTSNIFSSFRKKSRSWIRQACIGKGEFHLHILLFPIVYQKSANLQYNTGLLVWWDKWLVDQESDVPSIIIFFIISWKIRCKNGFIKMFYFFYKFTKIKSVKEIIKKIMLGTSDAWSTIIW